MATTTNFNWETPDDTDLVKDGAAAIRTLGSSIDTSFVDLKGGTTGQVLAKASGTDLDFTWVAQDDSNAIQNAIVDAKGDLISATGADTPARLAVGSNNQVLMADSSTATGLKWASPSSGMTLITRTALSGAVAHNIDSVFDVNTYSTYKIIFEKGFAGAGDQLRWQLRYGTTTQTTNYYSASNGYKYTGVALANGAVSGGSYFVLSGPNSTNLCVMTLNILGNTAYYTGQASSNDDGTFFMGGYNQSMGGTISGMRIITGGGTNNISGTLSIYGMAI